jgi:hypothetical protein
LLRVTQIEKSVVKFSLWNIGVLFDLRVGKSSVLIKKKQNYSLVAISNKNITLCCKARLQLNTSMVEEPGKVTILVFVFVELFKST